MDRFNFDGNAMIFARLTVMEIVLFALGVTLQPSHVVYFACASVDKSFIGFFPLLRSPSSTTHRLAVLLALFAQ